mmetsp:Transcript_13078/g.30541  ORF Transcript_13078/g.30541 Transcript_13078/m.30541 type:complete len:119 (-) Transcript_13078:160-516(-)
MTGATTTRTPGRRKREQQPEALPPLELLPPKKKTAGCNSMECNQRMRKCLLAWLSKTGSLVNGEREKYGSQRPTQRDASNVNERNQSNHLDSKRIEKRKKRGSQPNATAKHDTGRFRP